MRINQEDIQKFRSLWEEEFGEELPEAEARQRAGELLELYALLAGFPMSKGAHEETTSPPNP